MLMKALVQDLVEEDGVCIVAFVLVCLMYQALVQDLDEHDGADL